MKQIILTTAVSLFACVAPAQDDRKPAAPDQSAPAAEPVPADKSAPPAGAAAESKSKSESNAGARSGRSAVRPRAFLGIEMDTADDGKVTIVSLVDDGPAVKAGMQRGDELLNIDGTAVKGESSRVVEAVLAKKPEDTVEVKWKRGGEEMSANVTLAVRDPEGVEARRLRPPLTEAPRWSDRPFRDFPLWPKDDGSPPGAGVSPDALREGAARLFGGVTGAPPQRREEEIWRRVQRSVAQSLERAGVGPDVREKVTRAIEEARRSGPDEARRNRLHAEAERLEREMQGLQDRAEKLRQQLKELKVD